MSGMQTWQVVDLDHEDTSGALAEFPRSVPLQNERSASQTSTVILKCLPQLCHSLDFLICDMQVSDIR